MKIIKIDDYARAGKNDVTRVDEGYLDTSILIGLPSSIPNKKFFAQNPTGKMNSKDFEALQNSLRCGWDLEQPVTVFVEADGSATVSEGNHRLRAAHAAGIKAYTEIRYFGNGQKKSKLSALAE